MTEGDVGTTTALFNVTLSAPSGQIVVVGYDTFDGLAKVRLDYTASSGSLTFLPGQTSQTISVPILGDLEDEPNETFSIRLRSPLNVTIADGQGIGRILDNDPAPSFSISDATVVEEGDPSQFRDLYRDALVPHRSAHGLHLQHSQRLGLGWA